MHTWLEGKQFGAKTWDLPLSMNKIMNDVICADPELSDIPRLVRPVNLRCKSGAEGKIKAFGGYYLPLYQRLVLSLLVQ